MHYAPWLLPVFTTILIMGASGRVPAQSSCNSGGEVCDTCGPGTRCVGSGPEIHCECVGNRTGPSPEFYCADHTKYKSCHLLSDPTVKSLSGLRGSFDFIGSTRLVDVTTEYTQKPSGICHLEMWGWTSKYRGKIYLSGLGFRQQIYLSNGEFQELNGEITGRPEDCKYQYSAHLWSDGPSPFAASSTYTPEQAKAFGEKYEECGVKFIRTTKGHFMHATSKCCGLEFGFRIHHPEFPDRLPGMYFFVADSANPKFDTSNHRIGPICLDISKNVSYGDLIRSTNMTDRRSALTYQAITNSDFIVYQNAPPSLSSLKTELRSCSVPKRDELFQKAGFMFNNPHFIHCSASDDEEYVSVLANVVKYICHGDSSSCEDLKYTLYSNCDGHIDSVPGLDAFLSLPCPL